MQQPPQFTSSITQTYNVFVNPYGMRRLAPTFAPGDYDVLCARGKLAYDHEGNRRFRALVRQHQKQYSAATCKYEKSKIVSFIVGAVRNASPEGGFVKNIDGSWFEVGDRHAKEKVGQTFRDLLHTKYSSSTKAKARARIQKRMKDQQEEEDNNGSEPKKETKNETTSSSNKKNTTERSKPDAVTSDQEMRSSVSVISSDAEEDTKSDATTVAKSNLEKQREMLQQFPPLASVNIVKTEPPSFYGLQPMTSLLQHPGQQTTRPFLPLVSPSQTERTPSNTNNLLLGRLHQQNRYHAHLQQPILNHSSDSEHLLLPPSIPTMTTDGGNNSDLLEPLPIGGDVSVVNVQDFNESNSSGMTHETSASSTTTTSGGDQEQSFEDAMSEFCQNMSVAV